MSGYQASTPAPKEYGYPRSVRLRRISDLERVKKAGRRLRTEHLEVRATDSLLSHARIAVIVAKHGHTIVDRNQLRRRLKELARTKILPKLSAVDIVIRTLPSAYTVSFDKLAAEMDALLTDLLANAGKQ